MLRFWHYLFATIKLWVTVNEEIIALLLFVTLASQNVEICLKDQVPGDPP